jgi:hypothetical protein
MFGEMMLLHAGSRLRGCCVLFLLLTLATTPSLAQPAAPPPPKEYRVQVRYRIGAAGVGRLAQYRALTRSLESIGFRKDPGPENEGEDADQTRMTGTIASANAMKILAAPHVQAILLAPHGYERPGEADQVVRVQLRLKPGLPLDRQRLLAEQVRGLLRELGFHEAIGYDNRGQTRLVGTIPAGNLDLLSEDLRWQGSGWLVPPVPVADLPSPLRNTWPLQVVEVTPEPAGTEPAKSVTTATEARGTRDPLRKIASDLRALAAQEQPARIEVVLVAEQTEDHSWRQDLAQAAPGSVIEGRLGPIVFLRALPEQAEALAKLPGVSTVRLPRPASVRIVPLGQPPKDNDHALRASGLDRLHSDGFRGQRVRVAVIGSDFQGYQQFLGKQLPGRTHYVDLTAECEPSIEPKTFAGGVSSLGRDTQSALAIALAAPAAELTLVRIDPEAIYQLQEAARYIRGEPVRSDCLDRRGDELSEADRRFQQRRRELLEERRTVLDNFRQDEASVKRREAYFKSQADFDRQQQEHERRQQRFLDLVRDLNALKGIPVVACSLVWSDGYPVDGSSGLSQYLDNGINGPGSLSVRGQIPCFPLWFQAAGDTNGQAWAGLFRDVDGNGVMEFAPAGTPLKPDRWTSELNFLSWQPTGGTVTPDLPKARMRVSVQWREPHDPAFWRDGEDLYPEPLADVRLLILRQRDPTGTKLPSDDMELVARSEGVPLHLDNQPGSAMHEQTVEFMVDNPGRYAVRVEGRVPTTIRPPDLPTLPSLETVWELRPRLFVQVLDGSARETGRPVFEDYVSDRGNPGVPADARAVLSVGAVNALGRPEPYSSSGPALNQELRLRPDAFSFDELFLGLGVGEASAGTGLAAAFAAGTAATALSAGVPFQSLFFAVRQHPSRRLSIRRAAGMGLGK